MAVTKTLKDNQTGKSYTFNFDSEPTEQDLNDAMSQVEQSVSRETPEPQAPKGEFGQAFDRISKNFDTIGDAAADNTKTPTTLEKLGSVAGRTIGAVTSIPVELGKAAYNMIPSGSIASPQKPAPIVQDVKDFGNDMALGAGEIAKEHPRAATLAETGLNLTSALPVGKVASVGKDLAVDVAKGAARAAGDFVENSLGKTLKLGELKIPKNIANKSYGADLMEKKRTIVNDLADFGVTGGNNEDAAADALSKAQDRFNKADEIGSQLAADPSTPLVNPAQAAMRGIDVKKIASTGSREQAQNVIDKVLNDMADDGHAQPTTLDELIAAKQNLNNDGLLFVNGPAPSDADALGRSIKKKMYLNLVDAIGEASPEIKAINTEGKRLLDVHAALSQAASRNANHDAIGLTDFVLGGAGIAHPGSLAAVAPILVAKKTLGNGRAGNLAISLGRKMQGKEANNIDNTLANLKNLPDDNAPGTTAYDAATELPPNATTPTYFRQGINPQADNMAALQKTTAQKAQQDADAQAIPGAIQDLRPKYTTDQEKIDAMRRFQAGKQPDYPTATVEQEGTPAALQRLSSQLGLKYMGPMEADNGKVLYYDFKDLKTGGDFNTKTTEVSDILDALKNLRGRSWNK